MASPWYMASPRHMASPRLRERAALLGCQQQGRWGGDGCSCRGLPGSCMCRWVLHPHTQSRDESGVPQHHVSTNPPPRRHQTPWELTHVLCLPPPSLSAPRHPPCSQAGSSRVRPPSRQKSILRPCKGVESCPEPPRPFPVSLLLLLAAQRGAALTALRVQGSRRQEGTPGPGDLPGSSPGGAAPGRGTGGLRRGVLLGMDEGTLPPEMQGLEKAHLLMEAESIPLPQDTTGRVLAEMAGSLAPPLVVRGLPRGMQVCAGVSW